jgi:hypothetical protein
MPARDSARPRLLWLIPAAILFFGPAVSSLQQKSATFDEPVYIVAGLSYWTLDDHVMKADAPPLVAYLAGLSPWMHGLVIPGGRLPFDDPLRHEYGFASRLLYRSGADADGILFWSRLALLVPFGSLLLVTVLLWSTALFGPTAGLLALFLTALSPNLVAHARLVTADFACTAAMLFASHQLWRFTARPVVGRALAAGLALGLALVTKFTALILVPIFAVILLLVVLRPPRSKPGPAGWWLAALFLPAILVVTFSYGWPPDPFRYFAGVLSLYRNVESDYPWYVYGHFEPEGVPWYYLAVLAGKLALPLLLLGVSGVVCVGWRSAGLVAELCLLLPMLLLLLASAGDAMPAGIRRVLPVLPVLAIAASRWALSPPRLSLLRRGLLSGLLAFHALSSLTAWPHYIPYFNEGARALFTEQQRLDDSSIDWGQDLKALPEVLARHGVKQVHLWYYGSADPRFYRVRSRPMKQRDLETPRPGVYAASLHNVIRRRLVGPSWITREQPFDRAGTSILLFRVKKDSAESAGSRSERSMR